MDEETLGKRLIALVKGKYGWKFSKIPVEMLADLVDKELNAGDLAVYALLQCWGQEDGRFYYNRKSFRELTGIPERTIRDHVRRLEAAKWCSRHKEPARAGHRWPRVVVTVFPGKDTPPAAATKGVWRNLAGGSGENPPMEEEEVQVDTLSEKEGASPASPSSLAAPAQPAQRPRPTGGNPEDLQTEKNQQIGAEEEEDSESTGEEECSPADDAVRRQAPAPRGKITLTPDADDPEVLAEQKAAKAAKSKRRSKWPPKTGPDVYRRWLAEMTDHCPAWKRPPPHEVAWAKEGALGKKLMRRFEPDDLLAVLRIAIWDWQAIRGTDRFYEKRFYPTLQDVVRLADQLAGLTQSGWTDHRYRVSEYRRKFVLKIKPSDIIDMSAVADACRGRKKA